AEDGIRDRNVTGVQTCALPISYKFLSLRRHASVHPRKYLCSFYSEHKICLLQTGSAQFTYRSHGSPSKWSRPMITCSLWLTGTRSEERRVGKECRVYDEEEQYA